MGSLMQVLIAEDNKVNQVVAERMLQRAGHQVTVVVDGKSALGEIEKTKFDLFLLDIQMPVMDGEEALKLLRERERESGNHLPVIVITANARAEDEERFLKGGADAYLSKPLTKNSLFDKIAETLGREVTVK